MEEDGFVIVSKELATEDDVLSNASSRSSLFLVEDPAADDVMLYGEAEEQPTPAVEVSPRKADESSGKEDIKEDDHEQLKPEQPKQVEVRSLAISAKPTVKSSWLSGLDHCDVRVRLFILQAAKTKLCQNYLHRTSLTPRDALFSLGRVASAWEDLGYSLDVAVQADIVWEGYMGANKAAYLFGKVLNTEPAAEPRKQQLSTGLFLLQDIRCRSCSTPLGWSYLKAWSQDQRYKEGTTIIQQSLLSLKEEPNMTEISTV